MESLVEKYIKGFKFENTSDIVYLNAMDEFIGCIGKVVDDDGVAVKIFFNENNSWWYPKEEASAHLASPQEVSLYSNKELTENLIEESIMKPIDELEIENREPTTEELTEKFILGESNKRFDLSEKLNISFAVADYILNLEERVQQLEYIAQRYIKESMTSAPKTLLRK